MNTGDRLLYVLSARGEMGWTEVKRAFDALYGVTDGSGDFRYVRADCIRMLDALGHVESDNSPSSRRITVTQPNLALVPGRGLPTAVLTGPRSPATVRELVQQARKAGVSLEMQQQPWQPLLHPTRLSLVATTLDQLAAFASSNRLGCTSVPVSWSLLNVAGSLTDYVATLLPEQLDNLNWDREDFDPKVLRFTRRHLSDATRLSRYTHRTGRSRLHVLHQSGVSLRIEPDWGRFAILRSAGANVLMYDKTRFHLAAPATTPLPKLLTRALCMCSGWVPTTRREDAFAGPARLYRRVPPSFAQTVADKIGQRLRFGELRDV